MSNMEVKLTSSNILKYWNELKEYYSHKQLNDRLGELTRKQSCDPGVSYRIFMLDFSEPYKDKRYDK